MFEVEQSFGLTIEWDVPKPQYVPRLNPHANTWFKRLKPLVKHPGRRARVMKRIETGDLARSTKGNIKYSLRRHNAYNRWKIESGREDDGTWSIWVTFDGLMNEDEF